MRHIPHYIKKHPVGTILLIIAFVFHMMIMMPSGSHYCSGSACGYFFWGPHGHDGIWHISLMRAAFNSAPFTLPIFSGTPLSGYNYLLDLVLFVLSRIGISPLFSYFKIVPLVWFALFVWAAAAYAKTEKNKLFMPVFMYLIFFAGSFSYVFTLYHSGTLWGSSSVLSMQAAQTLTNPQFAFSLVVLLAVLLLLRQGPRTTRRAVYLSILSFLAFGLKFYGGVAVLALIAVDSLCSLTRRDTMRQAVIALLAAAVGTVPAILLFYDPFSSRAGGTFTFAPFAMVHSMIEDPNLFYLKDQVNARYFLQSVGWGPKLFRIELMTTALFLFFNFGVRTVGVVYAGIQAVRRSFDRHDLAVLAPPYDKRMRGTAKPLPLYQYDDTSYVPAFSGSPAYMADEVQLRLLGIPYERRRGALSHNDCGVLKDVAYLFETPGRPLSKTYASCGVKFQKVSAAGGFRLYSITK